MKAVNFVLTEAPEVEVGSGQSCADDLHYFCCVAGIGLDTEIARRANKLPRWLRAHGGYALTLPQALFHFAPFPMKISIPILLSRTASSSAPPSPQYSRHSPTPPATAEDEDCASSQAR